MEYLFMRSTSFNNKDVNTPVLSDSFNQRDSEPSILKELSSEKMIGEGFLSFKGRELETTFSTKSSTSEKGRFIRTVSFKGLSLDETKEMLSISIETGLESPKQEAALKLQKAYKSFRTRRQLADCAVLVEQRWWKLLEFASLKRSLVSVYDIDKPESVVSRWSRARTMAAKVGKGLSKNVKAQKLALQHWLEAIDPRHRYGHNLQFYYVCWLQCGSRQPFFYWLDVGEGKEVNLEHCPRTKLLQECIKYLGPKERESYEVIVEDGKFFYKKDHSLLDTTEGPMHYKWIFVLSTSKNLYVGQKKKGKFQHSSFLAGGATSAAGRLIVECGVLKAVWPHSGHYRPTEENFQELVSFLRENNVELIDVKTEPTEEDKESERRLDKNSSFSSISSTLDLIIEVTAATVNSDSGDGTALPHHHPSDGEASHILSPKIDDHYECNQLSVSNSSNESQLIGGRTVQESCAFKLLDMSCNSSLTKKFEGESEEEDNDSSFSSSAAESKLEGGIVAREITSEPSDYAFRKQNLFEEDRDENEEAVVPQESILRRMNSKKKKMSYQLGSQLSCRWTSGAGPRIGCVRDYPSELQYQALEQVKLSPKHDGSVSAYAFLQNITSQSPNPPGTPPVTETVAATEVKGN